MLEMECTKHLKSEYVFSVHASNHDWRDGSKRVRQRFHHSQTARSARAARHYKEIEQTL